MNPDSMAESELATDEWSAIIPLIKAQSGEYYADTGR